MVQLELEKYQQTMLADHPSTLSCIFIFCTLFILWLANRYRATKKLNPPPSPPKLPIIGNLHQLGFLLHRILHNMSEKYGPLMLLHLGSIPILIVTSADMVREIKVTHDITFANRPQSTAMKMLIYGCNDIAFSPYGERWAQLRKIAVMEMLSNRKVQSFRNVREEEIALQVQKINSLSSVQSPVVNIRELATTLANSILCRCAFGSKHGGQEVNKDHADLAFEVVKMVMSICCGDLFPRFGWIIDNITGFTARVKKLAKDLDMYFDQIIEEHLIHNNCDDQNYHQDFVDILLQIHKNDVNFTRDSIKGLVMDMFVAATETISTTLEWTMAELLQNPNVMRKAQEEVRRVVGKNKKVKEDDIQKMEYLKLVVHESMRLRPATAINVLESSKATNIKGFDVPAKTLVLINHWSIHRNSKSWERQDEFIPERFCNNPVDSGGQNFNFTPFGSGRRICPGKSFALIVVESTIANLLYWFDWKTVGGEKLDMSDTFGTTVKLKTPLHLVAVPHFS